MEENWGGFTCITRVEHVLCDNNSKVHNSINVMLQAQCQNHTSHLSMYTGTFTHCLTASPLSIHMHVK